MTSRNWMPRAAAWGLVVLLAGCAARQPLYSWNGYESQVYSHLKNEGGSSEEQILFLEKGLAETAARNAALPPGYQAHLGLLYLNTGRSDDAVRAWEKEKTAFPESAQYIDYLIGNLKKNRS